MKKFITIATTIIVFIGLGFGSYFLFKSREQKKTSSIREAVFLTNGEVYFGEITSINKNTMTLKNIFYLKTQDDLNGSSDGSQKKIALIKLGQELHGPDDEMMINMDNVLFYERMREDSKINDAIKSFLAKKD